MLSLQFKSSLGRAIPRSARQSLRFHSLECGSDCAPKKLVQEILDLSQFNTFIKANKLLVVDFYATWCGPCKAIEPVLEKLAERVPQVAFGRVDVDKAQDVAREYAITAMPTLITFKDGAQEEKMIGVNMPKLLLLVEALSK